MSDGPGATSWALEGLHAFSQGELSDGNARTVGIVKSAEACFKACFNTAQCNYVSTSLACGSQAASADGLDLCGKECFLWESMPGGSKATPPASWANQEKCTQATFPPDGTLLHTVWEAQTSAGAAIFGVFQGLPKAIVDRVPTCRYSVQGDCHNARFLCAGACLPQMGTNDANAYGTASTFCGQGSVTCALGFVVDASNQFYGMLDVGEGGAPIVDGPDGSITLVNGPATCTTPGVSPCPQCTSKPLRNRYFTYLRAVEDPHGKGWTVKVNGETVVIAPPSTPSTPHLHTIILLAIAALVVLTVMALLVWRAVARRKAARAAATAALAGPTPLIQQLARH